MLRSRLGGVMLGLLVFAGGCVVATAATADGAAAACATGGRLSAGQLNADFAGPGLGATGAQEGFGGGDYQHAYPLPDGRVLWLFQDMYFSNDNDLNNPRNQAAHNSGLIQNGDCFTVLGAQGRDFIGDVETIDSRRWFWPLDGEIGFDGNLWIYMVEMSNAAGTGATLGALPVRTWTAIIDPDSLRTLDFRPAADSGASRQLYGWSVVSNDQFSYLFGHCYRQFANNTNGPGDFDASCMPNSYVGRVALGHFNDPPEYWNGSGWTTNAAAAVPITVKPISDPMSVQWFGDEWVSVTKAGDWWGNAISVDVAVAPQGPWMTVQTIPVPNGKCASGCATYSAQLLPWLDPNGKLIIAISNGGDYPLWLANGALYRPTFMSAGMPALPTSASGASPPAFPVVKGTAGFVAVDPIRLVDTRIAGQAFGRLPEGGLAALDLNTAGMPAGTTAVALNLTAVGPGANGFVRAYPCAGGEPATSNVNQTVGRAQTNAAIVPVGDGWICFRTSSAVDLVVDLNGWLTTTSDVGLIPDQSHRVIDTRIGLGGAARLGPGQTIQVPVIGGGSPTTAVTLNVTAVDPAAPGFVTVYPCGVPRPLVSNLNPAPGVTQPNLINVRVGAGGTVCVFSSQETDLVVDLLAEYRPGAAARFSAVAPQRLLDSRNQNAPRHQSNLSFVVAMGSVVAAQVNLTAVNADKPGYLTDYPCMTDQWPGTSNVNFVTGLASANAALVTASRGYTCVFASTSTDVVFDISGVWTN